MKQTPTQNVGNTQNVGMQHSRWKTGRFSQASSTPFRCYLCGEIGHRAVHCKRRGPHRFIHLRRDVVLVEDQPVVPTMSKLNQSNATRLQLKPEIIPVPI